MTIQPYLYYEESQILPLYEAVGWRNYYTRPEMLRKDYENSLCTLAAYEVDRLVGIIRCVGDGYSVVLIQDILVLPECQRRGIGTALMQSVLKQYGQVYQIQLTTDNTEKTKAFYRAQGFRPLDELGCCGFMKA